MSMQVVLLGDSVFDNAAYVAGGPDVLAHLRHMLPAGATATLRAVDGAVVRDVRSQLARVPEDATHLVLSVGGNDALGYAGVLAAGCTSVAEALDRIADVQDQFRQDYRAMLDEVTKRALPTAVCTIYDPRYADPRQRRLLTTGLAIINDVIAREAVSRALPVIDLRLICDDDDDFANPIEPSVQGGAKIAAAVARLVLGYDFMSPHSVVLAR